MRTDSNHDVGKLINYFENYINDLNKDLTNNSKSNLQQQIRTTSQNTSHLSLSFADTFQPISTILPTIIDDEDIHPTVQDRTFSEDIYDRLTYQTLVNTNSYSSRGHLSVKSTKKRSQFNHPTHKKRLHRRRAPTYIKELKAYLAHRESSFNDIVKISDVKKFSNVLVWLSNQTTSPSLIETPPPISLIKTDNKHIKDHSLSITPDSVIAITQEISQSYSGAIFLKFFYSIVICVYSDPVLPFTDRANTSKSSSSRQSLTYLTYDNIQWKLKIRKEVRSRDF